MSDLNEAQKGAVEVNARIREYKPMILERALKITEDMKVIYKTTFTTKEWNDIYSYNLVAHKFSGTPMLFGKEIR